MYVLLINEADLVNRVLAAPLALAECLALLGDVHHGCCGWETDMSGAVER